MNNAEESNCIICGDEIIGGTTYSYDDCEFTCQKTENVGEVCRYTDDEKTIISTGIQTAVETDVDKSECCNNAGIDVGLQIAC